MPFYRKVMRDFWTFKLLGNVQRDKQHIELLKHSGWRIFIIWECETKDNNHLASLVREIRMHSFVFGPDHSVDGLATKRKKNEETGESP